MTQDEAKLESAKRALEFVKPGMTLGLGTGSTATLFIKELGRAFGEGKLPGIQCVASSDASRTLGESFRMPFTDFDRSPELDLCVDGADEIAPGLALIKGGGGALLREKIVISAAKQFVVVADGTKVVKELGKFPLPVEVIQLAKPLVQRRLERLGLRPVLRVRKGSEEAYLTDEGNWILDCYSEGIGDPETLAGEIRGIVGVVEHGLFLRMATVALVATEGGVEEVRA